MKSVEDYLDIYIAAAQAEIREEQVLCVGLLAPVGIMKGSLVGFVSPLAGMIMRKKARNNAQGFPDNILVAVTPTRLVSFEYKPSRTIKLVRRLVEWPRQSVRADQLGGRVVRFTFPDGNSVELEVMKSVGSYGRMNDAFLQAIGLSALV